MQYYRCCHILCSTFLALAPLSPLMANPTIPAHQFLQNMGASPKADAVYNFLNIYKETFNACQEIDAYLQALELLFKNGDEGVVHARLSGLNRCANLDTNQKNKISQLSQQLTPRKTTDKQAGADQTHAQSALIPQKEVSSPPEVRSNAIPSKPDAQSIVLNKEPQSNISRQLQENVKSSGIHNESAVIPKNKHSSTPPQKPVQTSTQVVNSKHDSRQTRALPDLIASSSSTTNAEVAPETTAPDLIVRPDRSSLGNSPVLIPPSQRPTEVQEDNLLKIALNSKNNWRNGDKGTGRLWRFENNVVVTNGPWSLSAGLIYLDSGRYTGNPTVGSPPVTPPSSQLITHATVFEPKISYAGPNMDLSLGTTPLGGEASPLPTFKWVWHEKQGGLSFFHESVTDSLLSTVGFKDIHGGGTMGRVIKTGATVNWHDDLPSSWFYGGNITGAYLYGKNVKENEAIKIESYFGKTVNDISTGLYASFDHFTRDLNHFTYGHGGYYSPQAAATLALFTSYKQTTDNTTLKADISVGLTYERIKDSPMYYFDNTGNTSIYKGEHKLKIPVNVGFNIQRKINSDLFLNLDGRVLNSRSYTEGRFSINLDYRF